jgi:carboxyl-terminal processing protease
MEKRNVKRPWIVSVAAVVAAVTAGAALTAIGAARGADLDGVWRSRGYGWIWVVKDGRVKAYDESGTLCLPSSRRRFALDDPEARLEISPDKKTIRILMDDDQFRYAFDRIDALPATCSSKPRTDPVSVFDAAVETLAAHYAFFDTRKIDWEAAVQSERSKISAKTRDIELFKAISRLLSNFRDSHVSLEGEIGDDELEYNPGEDPKVLAKAPTQRPVPTIVADNVSEYWNPRAAVELLETEESAFDDDIVYGLIDDDIGYLAIRSMSGDSKSEADRALRKALNHFKGTKALIIDVSSNDGGYDMTARTIAAHFTADRTLGYFKYPGDFGDSERQAIYVEPSGSRPYAGPIYLIAGRNTVSAAEIFVLSMRALPNVTQIGEPTDGSLSDMLSKPLPNGWSITLSNEVYLDSSGLGWEGIGIPPHVPVRMGSGFGEVSEHDIAAARRVVDHIRSMMRKRTESGLPSDRS